jgi:hypothetical protein
MAAVDFIIIGLAPMMSGNTNTTALMLAGKGADMILQAA